MPNTPEQHDEKLPEEKKDDIQVEPLSDEALEDVSGGAKALCPVASCSANVCSN